jgi:hypothetical protein
MYLTEQSAQQQQWQQQQPQQPPQPPQHLQPPPQLPPQLPPQQQQPQPEPAAGTPAAERPMSPKTDMLLGILDSDGDGMITREEFATALTTHSPASVVAAAAASAPSEAVSAMPQNDDVDISEQLATLREERKSLVGKADAVRSPPSPRRASSVRTCAQP